MTSSNSSAQEYCGSFAGNPVLPATGHLQCGLQTLDKTLMQSCCDGKVSRYQTCFLYCKPQTTFQDFVSCVSGGGSSAKDIRTDAFCQNNIVSTISEHGVGNKTLPGGGGGSKPSFATRTTSVPTISGLLTIVLLASFFFSVASADVVCQFVEHHHWNQTTHSIRATPDFVCSDPHFCTFGGDIDIGLTHNNRTLNGTSAAEAEWDRAFTLLDASVQPKRIWPAMSGLKLRYEWVALGGTTTYVSFSPVQNCVNGTVTACAGIIGHFEGMRPLEACGPAFVHNGNGLPPDDQIEGIFSVVETS